MSLRYGLTRAFSSIPKSTAPARSFITGPILQHGDCNPYSGSSMSRAPTRIPGPVELSIQQKVNDNLSPTLLHIRNDSSKHAHHRAMKEIGGGGGETHFTLTVVSPQFNDLTRIKRHRMINTLLKEEFDDKGLHALSLQLKTPAEWEQDIIAAEAKMAKQ